MSDESVSRSLAHDLTRGDFPIILLAAVVQGWSLYALHLSIDHSAWPATSPGTLLALYGTAVFVPLTVQTLARFVRRPLMWAIVAAFAAFYFVVGWHYGTRIVDSPVERFPDRVFEPALIVGILWLLVMPFVQARLIEGRWRSRYELLFSAAWNNQLVLAEAGVFTGIFWLMLGLWAQLFRMLDIRFFADLFAEPIFVYPVTSIVFGIALKLIGSLERLTSLVLEQALNVLKWLALLAGVILALFTVALVVELRGMIASGERAIAAVWLLWLVAVAVLLVNAAYRDGSIAKPYPRAIGLALRCVIPLTAIVAFVAVYALWLRIENHGLTTARFWGCVVAGAAVLYSVGYAFAARHGGHWMRSIATVNVVTALYLIAVLALALTPVLSPYRIAADSQFAMALAQPDGRKAEPRYYYGAATSPIDYLRFQAGKYGRDRLEELSRIEDHPRAEDIRREARAALERKNVWEPARIDSKTFLGSLVVQPPDRALDPQLVELASQERTPFVNGGNNVAGLFVDLNHDGTEEFVLLRPGASVLFSNTGGKWRRVSEILTDKVENADVVVARVRAGDFRVESSQWDDLVVGGVRYRLPPRAQ